MNKIQTLKCFSLYFLLYTLIGALSAWIPFQWLGMMMGSISIIIAAITLASLRTIEQANSSKDGAQFKPFKSFLIAALILLVIDIVYSLLV